MPKLPVNPEELSGALGALRKALTKAEQLAIPPALEQPAFIKEAIANSPPVLPDITRRDFLKLAGGAAAAGAVAASPLAKVAEHLLPAAKATAAPAAAAAPIDVGSKLADWFNKAVKEHGEGMKSDALGELEDPDFVPTMLTRMAGIKTVKDLAKQVGVPEQDLTNHILNVDNRMSPLQTIDELGMEHGRSALHHEAILEDGRPKEIWRSSTLGDVEDNLEGLDDGPHAIQPGMSFDDAHNQVVGHYLDRAAQRQMPLQAELFGPGFGDYLNTSTLWPDVEERLLDSGYGDAIYDAASDVAHDHPNVEHENVSDDEEDQ